MAVDTPKMEKDKKIGLTCNMYLFIKALINPNEELK